MNIERFPYKIGYDIAGVVVEIGVDVKGVKIGDEVYSRLPEANRGKSSCPTGTQTRSWCND